MERAVLLVGEESLILPQHLPPELHSHMVVPEDKPGDHMAGRAGGTLQQRLDELERACIVEALRSHRGHMGHAAQELGLTERVMALRMRKYGLEYKEYRGQTV